MEEELDTLIFAFAQYHDARLREICDEVGRGDLFTQYALRSMFETYATRANLKLSSVVDGMEAAHQKQAETERVQARLEDIFAKRKAPTMDGMGSSNVSARKRPVHVASDVTQQTKRPLNVDDLRKAVINFADAASMTHGLNNYVPKF